MMARPTGLLQKLSALGRTNREFVYSNRKIAEKRALSNAASPLLTTGPRFSLVLPRNASVTPSSVCSSRLRTSASARYQVTQRLAICARSLRGVRRWNTHVVSISTAERTIVGNASPLSPGRSAPLGGGEL